MPPWAAFECERTGWTLLMIPTDTPCSAAARAARWPASPAPITSTSWDGTGADPIEAKSDSAVGIRVAGSEPALAEPAHRRLGEADAVGDRAELDVLGEVVPPVVVRRLL